ncbi:hypothetical protein Tco_0394008 [Tanacetum coccineum]
MSSVGKFVHDSNKAPDSPPHPHTFSSNQRHCFHCKDVLGDGEFCQQCTCMRCGSGLSKGLCLICASRYGNNPNPNSLNDSPNISENVSQSPPLIDHHCCYGCGDSLDGIFCQRCTCESCGNGAHYGYNCPPQVPIISNPEPCNNQTVDELPQTLPSFNPTCYSGDGSSFTYDSTPNFVDDSPNVFNPPSQPPTYSCEFCGNDAHYGHDCPPQIPIYYDDDDDEESSIPLRDIIISGLPPCIAITPVLTTKEPVDSLIMEDEHLDTIPAMESDEFIKSSAEILVPTPSKSEDASDGVCYFPVYDDFPKSHLVTFSNPLFDIDDDCTSSDDESFSKEDVPMENFKFFSNPLFDLDEEIISTEIDSLLDEFAGELTLLKSIPPGIDDDNLDPEGEIHLVERLLYDNSSPRPPEELNVENSIESFFPSPIPIEDSDSLMEEIDVFLASDGSIPPGIKSDDYDSEVDDNSTSLPEFESFHVDYPDSGDSTIDVVEDIPVDVPNILPTHPTLHMDFDFIPSHNDLGSDLDVSSPSGDRNKIYDPGICIEVESTRFLATFSPVIDTLLPFSSENEDKVFNHGVLATKEKSPPSSSHRRFKASKLFHHKSPMLIHGENTPNLGVRHLHFYPP